MITGIASRHDPHPHRSPLFSRDRLSHPQGFSLLEVMIALFIVGTVLTVIIYTVNYQSGVSFDNAVTTHMYQVAKEKLWEMELHPVDSKGSFAGTDFFFVTTARQVEGTGMMEIRSVVSGNGREIALGELIVTK